MPERISGQIALLNAPMTRQENDALGRLLAVSANSAWNLLNFRRGLLRALTAKGYRISALVPPGEGVAELERMGIAVKSISISARGLSPFSDLRLLLSYRKRLDEIGPAAFLGFTAKPNIYGSIAARWCRVPVIANITGLGTGFLSGKTLEFILSGLYRLALVDAEKVFFHNPDDRSLFVRQGISAMNRSEVIPGSGVDLDYFENCPPPNNLEPVFLFIGRFLRDKGIGEFVEAARLVKRERPGVRFQALGIVEPHPKSVTLQAFREWENEGVVEMLGSAEDVRPLIAQADCVVLPSYREGLPRALLEASAMGRAVIGADVPGCRDVVEEGVTGFLCQARSAPSLAQVMMKFASLPSYDRLSMGVEGRRKASQEFAESRVIDAYVAALESILVDPFASATDTFS